MRPKHYDHTKKERTSTRRNWHNSKRKRRHRQIANLWWYYAGVLFMVRLGGRWMTDEQLIGGES